MAETAKELRLSRNGTYEAIRRGEIPSIRIGRRIVVPRVALQKKLLGESAEPAPARPNEERDAATEAP